MKGRSRKREEERGGIKGRGEVDRVVEEASVDEFGVGEAGEERRRRKRIRGDHGHKVTVLVHIPIRPNQPSSISHHMSPQLFIPFYPL